jgi:pimeloyl-ACP methyl ester carboxylesterase
VHASLDDADRQSVEAPGFLDRLRGLRIPTLVVHGELDTRPASAARELAAVLPAADFLLMPHAGHYPWLEAPDVLSAGLIVPVAKPGRRIPFRNMAALAVPSTLEIARRGARCGAAPVLR